jgi:cell division protein FtsB
MAAARARESPARKPPQPRPRPRALAGGRKQTRSRPPIRWDRISRLALLGVLLGLMLLFVGPALSYVSTWQKAKRERAVVTNLKRENEVLRGRRAALTHPGVLEREARSLGMTRPGERVFVLRGLPK